RVSAEEKGEVRGRVANEKAVLQLAEIPGNDVLAIYHRDEAAHLVDQLPERQTDAPAELEQVLDEHPGIAHDRGVAQPVAEPGHVAAHPRADGRDQRRDLLRRTLRSALFLRPGARGRREGSVEIVEALVLGRGSKLPGRARDQLVDVLDR